MMREGRQRGHSSHASVVQSLSAPFASHLDGNAIAVEDTLELLHLSDLEMQDLEEQQKCLAIEATDPVAALTFAEERENSTSGATIGVHHDAGDKNDVGERYSKLQVGSVKGTGDGDSNRPSTSDNGAAGDITELEACGPDPHGGTGIFRRVGARILPLFFSIALLCQLDRTNLAFAQLQLSEDLQFSDRVYGNGAGLFFIGYAIFQLPSNLMCVWLGAPLWLSIIVSTWGLVACLFATMRSSVQFYIQRVILGIAESGAYPAMFHHMTHFFDDWELGVGYSITASATAVSGLVGGWLAAGFLCMDGVAGLHGWQWLFLMEGIPTVILGLSIKVLLLKDIASAKFLKVDERLWLLQRQQKALYQKLQGSHRANSTTAALYDWRVWYLGGAWFLLAAAMDGIVFWTPRIIRNSILGSMNQAASQVAGPRCGAFTSGTGAAKISILSSGPSFFAAVAMIVVSFSSKRKGERHLHAALPTAAAALALGLLPSLVDAFGFWAGYVALIIAAIGIWGPHGPLMSWPALMLHGSAASTAFALMKTLGAFGSASGNFLIGLVSDKTDDFSNAMYLLAACTAVCTLMLAFFPEPGNEPHKKLLSWVCGSRLVRLFRRNRDELSTPLQELQMESLPVSSAPVPESPPSAALNGSAILYPDIHHRPKPPAQNWFQKLNFAKSRGDAHVVDEARDPIAAGHVQLVEEDTGRTSTMQSLSQFLRGFLRRKGATRPNETPLREGEDAE